MGLSNLHFLRINLFDCLFDGGNCGGEQVLFSTSFGVVGEVALLEEILWESCFVIVSEVGLSGRSARYDFEGVSISTSLNFFENTCRIPESVRSPSLLIQLCQIPTVHIGVDGVLLLEPRLSLSVHSRIDSFGWDFLGLLWVRKMIFVSEISREDIPLSDLLLFMLWFLQSLAGVLNSEVRRGEVVVYLPFKNRGIEEAFILLLNFFRVSGISYSRSIVCVLR